MLYGEEVRGTHMLTSLLAVAFADPVLEALETELDRTMTA